MKSCKSLVNDPRPKKDHPNPGHWDEVRKKVLKRDKNKCQTCYSDIDLDAHHRTYERFGKELPEDLVILCKECHEAITNSIRERRYRQQETLKFKNHISVKIKIISYEAEEIKIEDYRSSSPDHAQRSDGRPAK